MFQKQSHVLKMNWAAKQTRAVRGTQRQSQILIPNDIVKKPLRSLIPYIYLRNCRGVCAGSIPVSRSPSITLDYIQHRA